MNSFICTFHIIFASIVLATEASISGLFFAILLSRKEKNRFRFFYVRKTDTVFPAVADLVSIFFFIYFVI